jgi:hypothetical protein
MPPGISSWITALADVDRSDSRRESMTRLHQYDGYYLFPEPALFTSTNEGRRAKYFASWEILHGACIYRVYSSCSTATPLSNQQWRDLLLGALSLGDNTALSCTLEQVTSIFANTLENLSIDLSSFSTNTTNHFPTVSVLEMQNIVWELAELNFRFELLALDKRASSRSRDEDTRQGLILQCLSTHDLFVTDTQRGNVGLASIEWRKRLPCLLSLQTLMRDWKESIGPKPTPLILPDLPSVEHYSEQDVQLLEDAVTHFYTQSFFHFFGRAAIIPARLP